MCATGKPGHVAQVARCCVVLRWDFRNNYHKFKCRNREWGPCIVPSSWLCRYTNMAPAMRRKRRRLPVTGSCAGIHQMLPDLTLASVPSHLWHKELDPTEGCVTLLLSQSLCLTHVWRTPKQDLFTACSDPVDGWCPDARTETRPSTSGSSKRKECKEGYVWPQSPALLPNTLFKPIGTTHTGQ